MGLALQSATVQPMETQREGKWWNHCPIKTEHTSKASHQNSQLGCSYWVWRSRISSIFSLGCEAISTHMCALSRGSSGKHPQQQEKLKLWLLCTTSSSFSVAVLAKWLDVLPPLIINEGKHLLLPKARTLNAASRVKDKFYAFFYHIRSHPVYTVPDSVF
jgi:hypothetical protein